MRSVSRQSSVKFRDSFRTFEPGDSGSDEQEILSVSGLKPETPEVMRKRSKRLEERRVSSGPMATEGRHRKLLVKSPVLRCYSVYAPHSAHELAESP